jgi:hypothetical protein
VATFPINDRIVEPHDLTQAADLAHLGRIRLARPRHAEER